jgi:hypothetical protein
MCLERWGRLPARYGIRPGTFGRNLSDLPGQLIENLGIKRGIQE